MRTALGITAQENDKEPNLMLVNNTFNICKLHRGMIGNFLVQTIFDDHNKYSDLPLICPLIKGVYHVRDMPITDKFIPENMRGVIPNNVKYKIDQIFFIKLSKRSAVIELTNLHIDGKYEK